MSNKPLIYSGRASYKLAKDVCTILGVPLGDLDIESFADSEPWFRIPNHQDIKGKPLQSRALFVAYISFLTAVNEAENAGHPFTPPGERNYRESERNRSGN